MNRDDVIRLAREEADKVADFTNEAVIFNDFDTEWSFNVFAERFAALVAESERERCAKVCENFTGCYEKGKDMEACAEAIRALGDE